MPNLYQYCARFAAALLAVALLPNCLSQADEPAPPAAPPAVAPATLPAVVSALAEFAPTNAAASALALEQLQEQQKAILHAIEQVRQDAEAAARRNAESITGRLSAIEQSLTTERQQELEAMHKWNLFTLLVVGGFASLGFLGLLLVAPFLVRAMNRMSAAATTLSVGEPARFALPAPEPAAQALLPNPAVAQSTARFLEAIERLESRIHQLEHTVQVPQLVTSSHTNGGPKPQPDHAPEVLDPPERSATPELRAELVAEKGQTLLSLGKAEQALTAFEEAVALEPDNAELHVKKGRALEQLRRSGEALACYDRAIALEPALSTAYLSKGALLNQLARYTEAVQCYELALRVQEQSAPTPSAA